MEPPFDEFEELPITEEVCDLFPFPTRVMNGKDVLPNVFEGPELSEGFLPIILGEEWSVDRLADTYRHYETIPTPAQLLNNADGITSENFLINWRRINAQYLEQENRANIPQGWGTTVAGHVIDDGITYPNQPASTKTRDEHGFPRGPWPEVNASSPAATPEIYGHLDLHGRPHKEVLVGYLPLTLGECWHAAAHLFYFQYHSPNEVHLGLAREWYERYGARPVTFKHQHAEYILERPIMDKEEALEVAKVHYAYCWWSNKHGEVTIEELASGLLGSKTWAFHWT